MLTIADYLVIESRRVKIGSSGQREDRFRREFNLPDNFVKGRDRAKPILQYIWRPVSHPDQVGGLASIYLNVDLAGAPTNIERIEELTWDDATPRVDQALWTAIDGELFNIGTVNNIMFKVDAGNADFYGVILWFQENVDR